MIRILDLLFPPFCVCCGKLLPPRKTDERFAPLCGKCFGRWTAEKNPGRVGLSIDTGTGTSDHRKTPLYFVTVYGKEKGGRDGKTAGASRRILLRCKREDHNERFEFLASELLRVLRAAEVIRVGSGNGTDERPILVVPVPSSPSAVRNRGFEQSSRLAKCLVKLINNSAAKTKCVSGKSTESCTAESCTAESCRAEYTRAILRKDSEEQKYFSAAGRIRNAEKVNYLRKDAEKLIRGRRILVIDDISTTGASVSACAALLYSAGAAEVTAAVVGCGGGLSRGARPIMGKRKAPPETKTKDNEKIRYRIRKKTPYPYDKYDE